MYEDHDVLQEILDRAKEDLKGNPAAMKKLARLEKEYQMILGRRKRPIQVGWTSTVSWRHSTHSREGHHRPKASQGSRVLKVGSG
jgi:hypothetical protein